MEPSDLFDEIDLPAEVGAKGRNLDEELPLLGRLTALLFPHRELDAREQT